MAKKRRVDRRAKGASFRRASKARKSVLTSNELHLNRHDEDKVLLFVAGILFGTGVSVSILMNTIWYTGIVLLVLALIFLLIEKRQEGF